jgi:hypothetical protein
MSIVKELLKTDTQLNLISDEQLLLLADKVVSNYTHAGSIPLKEKDDIKMAMIEKFLVKRKAIAKAYKGTAKITTYCIAILNRMCCEEIRKESKKWHCQHDTEYKQQSTRASATIDKLVINDETKLLHRIIQLYDDERYKVRLFMAFFYQLSLIEKDLESYDKKYKTKELDTLFQQINFKNKGDIFKTLAYVVKEAEDKDIKPDAVRMWLNKTIEQIITRLNGPFNRAHYNKESAQILYEYYHNQRSINKHIHSNENKGDNSLNR